jgi:hypothetical protein
MISENLHGDCLYLLTCRSERHAILVMPLQLGQKPQLVCVIPRVTFFPNYLHYKINQVSSALVNQVIKVQNQNSKLGVQI